MQLQKIGLTIRQQVFAYRIWATRRTSGNDSGLQLAIAMFHVLEDVGQLH